MTSYLARAAARRALLRTSNPAPTPAQFTIGSVVTVAAVFLAIVVVWLLSIAIGTGQ